jgi:ABC-2 type transport system ATP-binding protein
MNAVEVRNVTKKYGSRTVVDNVSFSVSSGEILGMIGPNGAGKTTNIRMIMDVIKPDSGEVSLFGRRFNNELKKQIGYLPEERGLYRKKPILDSMIYLAALKGLDSKMARSRAEKLLTRVNMQAHQNKKIEELSHGMAQIIQILVTILHEPDVIILDEPFNGLDPVNVKMVKDMILELKNQGKAIMLSTHRMNEVEELCDRIFMINKGRNVLYGSIGDVKAKYRDNSVIVEFEGDYEIPRNFRASKISGRTFEIFPEAGMTYQELLKSLVASGSHIVKFEVSTPSLNDIFIRLAGGKNE